MAGPRRPDDPGHFDWGAGVVGPAPGAGQAGGGQPVDPQSPGWAYLQGWQQPAPAAPSDQPAPPESGGGQPPSAGGQPPTAQPPAAQPPTGQPPYGAPPAGQPGWGTPPPGYGAPPPGYGAPPPGYGPPPPGYPQYPGYPPAGYQPGWPPQPQPASSTRGKGCLIAAIAALAVVAVLVVGCVALVATTLGPAIDVSMKMQSRSNGQVQSASYNWNNGHGEFDIHLAPGVSGSAGQQIACQVVRPLLDGTKFENDSFYIFDSRGFLVADSTTPCS